MKSLELEAEKYAKAAIGICYDCAKIAYEAGSREALRLLSEQEGRELFVIDRVYGFRDGGKFYAAQESEVNDKGTWFTEAAPLRARILALEDAELSNKQLVSENGMLNDELATLRAQLELCKEQRNDYCERLSDCYENGLDFKGMRKDDDLELQKKGQGDV